MKTGLAIVVAALVAFGAGFLVGRETAPPSTDLEAKLAEIQSGIQELKERPTPSAAPTRRRTGPDPNKIHEVKLGSSPSKGPADAPITIVEFSDFQCPYCGRVGPTLDRLLKEYPGQVRVVYKHLPLSFHKDALPAAKASIAAGRQGKFWEMHDLLFQNQRQLKEAKFKELATSLGLDLDQFERDYKSADVATEVAQDMNEARRLGVTGTPGFFINGRFTSGAKPYDSFKALVEAELQKKS